MDLTSYGRLVAAFDELKLKAEDELKWEQCSWAKRRAALNSLSYAKSVFMQCNEVGQTCLNYIRLLFDIIQSEVGL
jgi:hypothetical protein